MCSLEHVAEEVSGFCDLLPGFGFTAFSKAPNPVTVTSVSVTVILSHYAFICLYCLHKHAECQTAYFSFCSNDCVFSRPRAKTEEFTFLTSIKTFCWRHISGPCSRITPLKQNSFARACRDGWMDGNPFYWFNISEIPRKATV